MAKKIQEEVWDFKMKNGKRPNIIIFNPDEMRWNTMGHMGNPAAYTPNLDRFAREDAVSFSHAYCQNPVCVPSRCSFATGLYPHTRGHRTMQYLLHEEETSIFRELKEAGYHVWMNSRNDLVAGQFPGLAESHADEIYYYDKNQEKREIDLRRMGKMMAGKEDPYPYSHFKGVTEYEMSTDADDIRAAVERIKSYPQDKPLCMFVGLVNPHPPYVVKQKYYDQIKKDKIPPRIKTDGTVAKSRMMAEIRKYAGLESFTEEQWKEIQTVYLAQCAMVDELFQKLCDALKEAGMYEDSAIFVLSDHGDFAGDYDITEKAQNTFEDCLTRVPLLIKPPKGEPLDAGIAGGVVELVDFYATAMDYAGVKPAHDHFGCSLRPVIEDRTKRVRQYAFCEGGRMEWEEQCDEYHSEGPQEYDVHSEYWARMKAQCNPLAHEKGTMICDGMYKYVERPSGANEFYDLKNDPQEKINLYPQQKDSGIVQKMRLEMLKWYQQTCDVVPKKYDNRFTEERVWASVRKLCPAALEKQMREYIRTGATIPQAIQYAVKLRMQGAGQEKMFESMQ